MWVIMTASKTTLTVLGNETTKSMDRVGPVPGYDTDPNKKVVVTYSSINGNGFGGWGEVVLGSKGTLILDKETDVLLYRNSDTSSKVGVAKQAGGFALDTSASGDYSSTRSTGSGLRSCFPWLSREI